MLLPEIIKNFIKAVNTGDEELLKSCISQNCHIYDQGEDSHINGLLEITEWIRNLKKDFELTSEIKSSEEKLGVHILSVVAIGNFPSSPHQFYYFFTLTYGLISNITIILGKPNISL